MNEETEKDFEAEFYEWAKKNLLLSKAAIEKNETQKKATESIINAMEFDRVTLGTREITLKLIEPVGDLKEVTASLRAKPELSQILSAAKSSEVQLKLVSTICNVPIAVVKDLDYVDFRILGETGAFLL